MLEQCGSQTPCLASLVRAPPSLAILLPVGVGVLGTRPASLLKGGARGAQPRARVVVDLVILCYGTLLRFPGRAPTVRVTPALVKLWPGDGGLLFADMETLCPGLVEEAPLPMPRKHGVQKARATTADPGRGPAVPVVASARAIHHRRCQYRAAAGLQTNLLDRNLK